MKREEIKVCIMRVGGTNCDAETRRSFRSSGMQAEVVHFGQLVKKRSLLDYDILVIPGGFSHGDYVRAGAIWAKQLMTKLRKDVAKFVEEERPILGICNGFQVLVEAGLLPRFNGVSPYPKAALANNTPSGFTCRWTYLKHESNGNCVFTRMIPPEAVVRIPVAHAEGRFVFARGREEKSLEKLIENDQLVLRFCHSDGAYAEGRFPSNPNGSFHDVAGICDPTGTTFGLMPHPERAYFGWQLPDWTRGDSSTFGHGKLIFDSVAEYLERKF